MSQVELSVASQLGKIVADLEKIAAASKKVEDGLKQTGDAVDDALGKGTKKTELKLDDLRKLSARVASQITKDFKALASLQAVTGSLAISNQFKGTLTETFALSDAIRKLGNTFGIASGNFASFQSKITKGLGEVGLSSQVATDALQALADTPVRGEAAVTGYAKTSGELASLSNQKGQEGSIAKGIAETIRAQGGNPNDLKQVSKVAEDLRRVFNQTGKAPTETLKAMSDLFSNMPKDMRAKIGTRGLSNLAAAGQVAGPGSTQFLEELLGKSPIARKALQAQGFGNVVNDNGLDIEKFKKASSAILGRIGMDPEAAAQTLGISEEAAKGFVRLAQSLDKVKDAQNGIAKQTGSVEGQYKDSMGAAESFRASINHVKSTLAGPLAYLTQKGTSLLSGASQTDLGAAGVVGGGALLAALLAGGGLRGIGGALGGVAKGAAAEGLTGKEVQPVYVVNMPGAGIGGGIPGVGGATAAGGAGILGAAGLGVAAVSAGIGLSAAATQLVQPGGVGAAANAVGLDSLAKAIDQLEDVVTRWSSSLTGMHSSPKSKVEVELKSKDLKPAKSLSNGATY